MDSPFAQVLDYVAFTSSSSPSSRNACFAPSIRCLGTPTAALLKLLVYLLASFSFWRPRTHSGCPVPIRLPISFPPAIVGQQYNPSREHRQESVSGPSVGDPTLWPLARYPAKMPVMFTPKQGQCLAFIYYYTKLNGHAFLWSVSGDMQDLGTLGGTGDRCAYGVSNSGHVVGTTPRLPGC